MKRRRASARYLLCVKNDGYATSLLPRRLHEQVSDTDAEAHGLVRVLDESGEDYLYPKGLFVELNLPAPVVRAIAA
jgi:hypothetical protein